MNKSDYPLDRDETNTRRGLRGVLLRLSRVYFYRPGFGSLPVRLFQL